MNINSFKSVRNLRLHVVESTMCIIDSVEDTKHLQQLRHAYYMSIAHRAQPSQKDIHGTCRHLLSPVPFHDMSCILSRISSPIAPLITPR